MRVQKDSDVEYPAGERQRRQGRSIDGSASVDVQAVLALQRSIGNGATTALLGGLFAVQRDDDDQGGDDEADGVPALGSSASGSSPSDGSSSDDGAGGPGAASAGPLPRGDCNATHIGGALSSLPIWHTLVVYTDTSGKATGYRGGPGGPPNPTSDPSYGTIQGTQGAYGPGFIDYPAVESVAVASGPSVSGADATFASELSRIDSAHIDYHPTGPNSNTTAKTLLDKAGLPLVKPVTLAPGWGDADL